MNKICQLVNTSLNIANQIGYRNIAFFGLLGTAVGIKYIFPLYKLLL